MLKEKMVNKRKKIISLSIALYLIFSDQRRMENIISYLTRLRVGADKFERHKQKQPINSIFTKLESAWKTTNLPNQTSNKVPVQQLNRFGLLKILSSYIFLHHSFYSIIFFSTYQEQTAKKCSS